jgi:hypothetical protein
MAQKQKRNHWMPQAYLRSFAADPAAQQKIWTLSKDAGPSTFKPIKKVAVRFYLYAPRRADGNRHNEPDGGCYRSADIASLNGLLWQEAIDHMFSPRHPDIVCHGMLNSVEAMGIC